ncbi:hypothetical protein U1Q18_024242 [Sarracenia purpurea var. burkii]
MGPSTRRDYSSAESSEQAGRLARIEEAPDQGKDTFHLLDKMPQPMSWEAAADWIRVGKGKEVVRGVHIVEPEKELPSSSSLPQGIMEQKELNAQLGVTDSQQSQNKGEPEQPVPWSPLTPSKSPRNVKVVLMEDQGNLEEPSTPPQFLKELFTAAVRLGAVWSLCSEAVGSALQLLKRFVFKSCKGLALCSRGLALCSRFFLVVYGLLLFASSQQAHACHLVFSVHLLGMLQLGFGAVFLPSWVVPGGLLLANQRHPLHRRRDLHRRRSSELVGHQSSATIDPTIDADFINLLQASPTYLCHPRDFINLRRSHHLNTDSHPLFSSIIVGHPSTIVIDHTKAASVALYHRRTSSTQIHNQTLQSDPMTSWTKPDDQLDPTQFNFKSDDDIPPPHKSLYHP